MSAPTLYAECACGHDEEVHEHYRSGADCGFSDCTCGAYRDDDDLGLGPWTDGELLGVTLAALAGALAVVVAIAQVVLWWVR